MPVSSSFADLVFPIGRGRDLRLVDRPGRTLAPGAADQLLADLREVADRCLPSGALRYGVLSGEAGRLESAVVAIVYERGSGRPLGFNAMAWMDVTVAGRETRMLHAGLCMVAPGARQGGLLGLLSAAPAILAFACNRFRELWVSNVTQVPVVAGRFSQGVAGVYPAPGVDRPPSDEHLEVALQIMSRHRHVFGVGEDADFDPGRFVIRNAYTGGSDELKKRYEDAGKHRDERYNRLCRDLLDYDRGDDLLQVGKLNLSVVSSLALDFLRRVVERKARACSRSSARGFTPRLGKRRAGSPA